MARKIAAGNWKMNGDQASLEEAVAISRAPASCDVVLCPPATLTALAVSALEGSNVQVGGQDCHANSKGAHTGDISAAMLRDAGASHVILGHSERRADHGETNAEVAAKVTAAHREGLIAILCLGETESQRDAGKTLEVVAEQLAGSLPESASAENTVIAYEPVWAIGTGRTATPEEIGDVHAALRAQLSRIMGPAAGSVPLLYGGSVKAANAAEIFSVEDVDGALVGGASLKAQDFVPIIEALSAS